jgi:hypothetical protein
MHQGALHWTANAQAPLLEFWTLLNDTMAALGEDFVAVGADEMARLAAEALHARRADDITTSGGGGGGGGDN